MPMQIVHQKSLYFSWSVESLLKEDTSHPSSRFNFKPRERDGRAAREEGGQPRGQPECIETTTNSYPTASLLPAHRGTWQRAQAQMRVSMGTITMKIQDKDGPDQHKDRTANGGKRSPAQGYVRKTNRKQSSNPSPFPPAEIRPQPRAHVRCASSRNG